MNINQMKQSINIRCTQYFSYFKSHKKSLKQLRDIVCFSSAFTIHQHILLTNVYLEEISRKELYRLHVQTMVQK